MSAPKLAKRIAAARQEIDVDAQLALAEQHSLGILLPDADDYPRTAPGNPRPAGGAVHPWPIEIVRPVGRRHRRHAACHALRPGAGEATGRQPGPSGDHRSERHGPGHRQRGPSRGARGRWPNDCRPGQRRAQSLPAGKRQACRGDRRARLRHERGRPHDAAAQRDVPPTQPDHQRPVAGHDRGRGGRAIRRSHHPPDTPWSKAARSLPCRARPRAASRRARTG